MRPTCRGLGVRGGSGRIELREVEVRAPTRHTRGGIQAHIDARPCTHLDVELGGGGQGHGVLLAPRVVHHLEARELGQRLAAGSKVMIDGKVGGQSWGGDWLCHRDRPHNPYATSPVTIEISPGLVGRDGLLRLDGDGLRMRAERGDAHRRARDRQVLHAQNLTGLPRYLWWRGVGEGLLSRVDGGLIGRGAAGGPFVLSPINAEGGGKRTDGPSSPPWCSRCPGTRQSIV